MQRRYHAGGIAEAPPLAGCVMVSLGRPQADGGKGRKTVRRIITYHGLRVRAIARLFRQEVSGSKRYGNSFYPWALAQDRRA